MTERRVNDKPSVDPAAIASEFLAERYSSEAGYGQTVPTLRWWREGYYGFDDGRYREIPVAELKAEIAGYLRISDTKVTTHTMAATLLCLNSMIMVRHYIEPESWLDDINGADVVVAANGNVSFSDRDAGGKPKLLRHSPSFFSLTRLPYDYDPKADCRTWKAFVSDVMSNDDEYVTLLQQWCGYLFRRDLDDQRFMLLVGDGSNGKTVFCDVVESLVGPANVSHVPLALFGRPFSLWATVGKRANITTESHHLVDDQAETLLKAYTSGDPITFERKYREAVDARPTAKVMVSTNALPRFQDRSNAIWRRLLLVPFNQTYGAERRIKGLAGELKKELPGIFNWALEGLESLNQHNDFIVPASHAEQIEQYRRDADPARAFLVENFTPSANGESVQAADIYSQYRTWCNETGCRALSDRMFGQSVRRVFPAAERVRLRYGTQRPWAYKGIMENWEDG